jgi:hypothetical protein
LKIRSLIEFYLQKKPSQQLRQTILLKEVNVFLKQILPVAATLLLVVIID